MFNWIDYAFWAADFVANLSVVCVAYRSRRFERWYSVSTYCGIQVVLNAVLAYLYIHRNWAPYFYVQWYSELGLCVVKILILWQVIISAINHLAMVPRSIQRAFLVSVVSAGLAAFIAGAQGVLTGKDLPVICLILNRATSMSVVTIFAVFAIFSAFFGLRWKGPGLRIDLGLNLIAVSDLISFLAELKGKLAISYRMQTLVHVICLMIWATAFAATEPRLDTASEKRKLQIRRLFQGLEHDLKSRG